MITDRARTYPALDSLRALAAVAVVATHCSFQAGLYSRGQLGAATSRLDVGVAIFFVLSGFLLGRPYVADAAGLWSRDTLGRYCWKRVIRIFPAYWVAVIAALVLLPQNRNATPGDWLAQLTLTELYRNERLAFGLTQMWSLSTEVAFYVLLPIGIAVAARRLCRRRWAPGRLTALCLGLAAVSVLWLGELSHLVPGDSSTVNQWLPAYLSWFAVGLLFAVLSVDRDLAPPGRRFAPARLVDGLGRSPWTCWLAAGFLFVVASTPVAGPLTLTLATSAQTVTKNLLYAAIAGLLVLPCVFGPSDSGFARALSHRWPRHVGHISYSLFCCHLIVLELVFLWRDWTLFDGHGLELFVLTLSISLGVSEVLYRVVELPAMRLRRTRRPLPKADEDASPSAISTAH